MKDSSDQQQQQRPSTTTTTTTNSAQAPQPTTQKKKKKHKTKTKRPPRGESGSTAQILCDFLSFFFLFCLCVRKKPPTDGTSARARASKKERTKPALQIRPPTLSFLFFPYLFIK
jgi:hypothetical protein